MDSNTRINPEWTVGELIEEFEGHDFLPTDTEKDHFLCDWCSTGVSYSSEPRVAGYVADRVINTDHPTWVEATLGREVQPLVPLASYCKDCSQRKLLFPCEGFAEVRYFFDLDEDMVMRNVEVTDVSPRDDGIPWDPKALAEAITQTSWKERGFLALLLGGDHLWGPENMVTFFLSVGTGVDIRELVKWDGSLDPKALGRARRKYKEFQKMMKREGHSRQAFRDHVRGEDDG